MKRMAWVGICVAAAALGLAGCDWDTGSDADHWNSDYNWVNFSGTYRSAAGGLLVTDYTTTPSTPGSTNTLQSSGEAQGSFAAGKTSFKGTLGHGNLVKGSLVITLYNSSGGVINTFADDGNGILGSASQGTVQYVPGSWTLTLTTDFPTVPGYVRASYSYYVSNAGSTGGGANPGSTGRIYSFVLVQKGENLTFTDNNGAVYKGKIGEMRTASGVERDDEEGSFLPQEGDTLVATIECSGTSAALMQVKIVGTLQGTVASDVFTGRTLTGTWIEAAGKTGDINGQTTSIPIVSGTTDTAVDTNAAAMVVSP